MQIKNTIAPFVALLIIHSFTLVMGKNSINCILHTVCGYFCNLGKTICRLRRVFVQDATCTQGSNKVNADHKVHGDLIQF